jgi:hypothetical protein
LRRLHSWWKAINRYDGINIRIANELQKRTGIQFDVMVVPTPRHVVLFPADTRRTAFLTVKISRTMMA